LLGGDSVMQDIRQDNLYIEKKHSSTHNNFYKLVIEQAQYDILIVSVN